MRFFLVTVFTTAKTAPRYLCKDTTVTVVIRRAIDKLGILEDEVMCVSVTDMGSNMLRETMLSLTKQGVVIDLEQYCKCSEPHFGVDGYCSVCGKQEK